jgi:hypothetical protein
MDSNTTSEHGHTGDSFTASTDRASAIPRSIDQESHNVLEQTPAASYAIPEVPDARKLASSFETVTKGGRFTGEEKKFDDWKLTMKATLRLAKLWDFATGKVPKPPRGHTDREKWEEVNVLLLNILILTTTDMARRIVQNHAQNDDGVSAFKAILDKYESNNIERRITLIQQLLTTKMVKSDPEELILKLEEKRAKYHATYYAAKGKSLDDDDVMIGLLLGALPEEYDPVRATIHNQVNADYDVVKEHVRAFYRMKQHNSNNNAEKALFSNTTTANKSSDNQRCGICRRNHPTELCRLKDASSDGNNSSKTNKSHNKQQKYNNHNNNSNNNNNSTSNNNNNNKHHHNNNKKHNSSNNSSDTNNGYKRQTYDPCTYCGYTNHPSERCFYKDGSKKRTDGEQTAFSMQRRRNIFDADFDINACSVSVCDIPRITTTDLQLLAVDFPHQEYIIDTGASSNSTYDIEDLHFVRPYSGKVIGINGESLDITAIGELWCTITDADGTKRDVVISEVKCIPKQAVKLLSVSQLIQKGFTFVFSNIQQYAKHSDLPDTELKVKLVRGHYFFDNMSVTKVQYDYNMASLDPKLSLVHRRLGHINMLDSEKYAEQFPNTTHAQTCKCDICVLAKSTRASFKARTEFQHYEPFELVYSDIIGPLDESLGGSHYAMVLVDERSRYSWLLFMKYRSQAKDRLKEFLDTTVREYQGNVKHFRTDNAKEYISGHFNSILHKHSIKPEHSAPYTPEQNGVAERKLRTIVTIAAALLKDSNLPQLYWSHAMQTANYIAIRVNTTVYGKADTV